ncbi:MAG: hypothetical protein P4L41_01470 [Flavipsychrobacter sp.]|nr:hypothetical protein [Flavipsychrobacter sp.]
MPTVSNLSPLAFEILKYVCNTGSGGVEQNIDKDSLGISTQEDFLNALEELQQAGLVTLSRDARYEQHTTPEELATESLTHAENSDNMTPISVKLAGDESEVCKAIDYYLEAGRKSE